METAELFTAGFSVAMRRLEHQFPHTVKNPHIISMFENLTTKFHR